MNMSLVNICALVMNTAQYNADSLNRKRHELVKVLQAIYT